MLVVLCKSEDKDCSWQRGDLESADGKISFESECFWPGMQDDD